MDERLSRSLRHFYNGRYVSERFCNIKYLENVDKHNTEQSMLLCFAKSIKMNWMPRKK